MEEVKIETIKWQAPEYDHKNKSADFLWTIGLVTLVACGLAVWLGNYVFAIFILVSGACLIMFTIREPEDIEFTIETEGVRMGKDSFAWKSIKSFNIKSGDPYGKLIFETSKYFMPVYTVPLPKGMEGTVKEAILKFAPQSEIAESRSMQLADKLGF